MYVKNGIYHIYNRGCNKNNIFFNKDNYLYLLRKLKEVIDDFDLVIIAYCLMPNHYQEFVEEYVENQVVMEGMVKYLFD